jgi:hypothetical protein
VRRFSLRAKLEQVVHRFKGSYVGGSGSCWRAARKVVRE